MPNTHEISLAQAVVLTSRYRNNRPSGWPLSETFNKEAIEKLLSTEGCKFIRIYPGMKEDLSIVNILVAVNDDNEDILPQNDSLAAVDPVIVEDGFACPPLCPKPSPLNG